MRVLLTEDDLELAKFTAQNLKKQGFAVDLAYSGKESLALLETEQNYDVVVLDLNLPDIDGLKIFKKLKTISPTLPILALTARDKEEDKILGLKSGFDDYLTKPFSVLELATRIKVLCRLPKKEKDNFIKINSLKIFPKNQKVFRGQKEIKLSLNEFRLLHFLAKNQGREISPKQLLESVWDMNLDNDKTRLLTTLSRLRKKIGDCQKTIIKTTKNGYLVK